MTRRVFALGGARLLLPLLLFLLIFVLGSLPTASVIAFPATAISPAENPNERDNISTASNNNSFSDTDTTILGAITEYPVFIPETDQETQTESNSSVGEPEVATESFMVIEEQEVDEDGPQDYFGGGDGSSSTESPAIVRSTLPMQPPKSSPEQEEVLRELKKLWDLSEGLSNTENDIKLKSSLSSIVHLAYARVYIEPDETLHQLKHLLRQLQAKITETNHDDENMSTTETSTLSSTSSTLPSSSSFSSTEPNYFSATAITTNSPSTTANLIITTTHNTNPENVDEISQKVKRKKRSYFDDFEEIENIFFANVNSQENSVIPEEKNYPKFNTLRNETNDNGKHNKFVEFNNIIRLSSLRKNDTIMNEYDPLVLSSSSSTVTSITSTVSPTPSTMVQKVIHINDRRKPSPSFFLSPERLQELKDRMKTTTSTTLPPIGVIIDDDIENEVNSLQMHQNADNFDIHISESVDPLLTTTHSTPALSFIENDNKKPSLIEKVTIPTKVSASATSTSTTSTTESPFTAEELAIALFNLLKPEASYENEESDEGVTKPPHPSPSNILYEVDFQSSIFNFTVTNNSSKDDSAKLTTTSTPSSTTVTNIKVDNRNKTRKNSTLLAPPAAFANLGYNPMTSMISTSTTTERLNKPELDIYDYTDVADPASSSILDATKDGIQTIVNSVTRLSVGAKMIILFSVSISILSIGFGIIGLGPSFGAIGFLGIIIPVFLLLLFETTATPSGKKRKLTKERQKQIIKRIQSEEFSKVLDMIFDAVIKYGKG